MTTDYKEPENEKILTLTNAQFYSALADPGKVEVHTIVSAAERCNTPRTTFAEGVQKGTIPCMGRIRRGGIFVYLFARGVLDQARQLTDEMLNARIKNAYSRLGSDPSAPSQLAAADLWRQMSRHPNNETKKS